MKSNSSGLPAHHSVEVREKELEVSGARDVLVRSVCSAISAGTEMLVFEISFLIPWLWIKVLRRCPVRPCSIRFGMVMPASEG